MLGNIDLTGFSEEVREQYEKDLAMLMEKQRPVNFQFYAPLFNRDSLLAYLPEDALLVLDEPRGIELAVADLTTSRKNYVLGSLSVESCLLISRDRTSLGRSWREV